MKLIALAVFASLIFGVFVQLLGMALGCWINRWLNRVSISDPVNLEGLGSTEPIPNGIRDGDGDPAEVYVMPEFPDGK